MGQLFNTLGYFIAANSSILDVCTMRRANIDSGHYFVVNMVRNRIAPVKKSAAFTCRNFAIEKLQSAQTTVAFENRITTLLAESSPLSIDIDLERDPICDCMHTAALATIALNTTTGMTKNPERHLQGQIQTTEIHCSL